MDIKLDILSGVISETIKDAIEYLHIDTNDVIPTVILLALQEIQNILCNDEIIDDFDVVEKIVLVFEKYQLDAGNRHDFG